MKSSTFHASLKSKHVEGEVGKGINTYNIYGQAQLLNMIALNALELAEVTATYLKYFPVVDL